MSTSPRPISERSHFLKVVKENDLRQAAVLVDRGADVNARMADEGAMKSARDILAASVTASQIYDISRIPVPFDVTLAIVYAVCLIVHEDHIPPQMSFLEAW